MKTKWMKRKEWLNLITVNETKYNSSRSLEKQLKIEKEFVHTALNDKEIQVRNLHSYLFNTIMVTSFY